MAVSTAEPGGAYRVTAREKEAEKGKRRESDDRGTERETSFKRVLAVPQGGQSDAISLSSLSPFPPSCEDCLLSHLKTDSDAFSSAAVGYFKL